MSALFADTAGRDPDAELKERWQIFQAHARSFPEGCSDEAACAWVQKSAELEARIAELPAHTLAGLSIKIQMLAREVGETSHTGVTPLINSTIEALERLIPEVVARDLIQDCSL